MAMTDVNHELMLDVLVQIEREPRRWMQSTYGHTCESAHCFAGWAVTLSRPQMWKQEGLRGRQVAMAADELLGIRGWLSRDGNNPLYEGGNTIDDIYQSAAWWMGIDVQVLRDKIRDRI